MPVRVSGERRALSSHRHSPFRRARANQRRFFSKEKPHSHKSDGAFVVLFCFVKDVGEIEEQKNAERRKEREKKHRERKHRGDRAENLIAFETSRAHHFARNAQKKSRVETHKKKKQERIFVSFGQAYRS